MSRVECLIDGCQRTTKWRGYHEWICQPHWSAIPRSKRAIYNRVKRRYRMRPTIHNAKACARIWRRMKIFAQMGGL